MGKVANRARMTTATTGTGTLTLGSAVGGYATFAEAGISNGDVVSYAIVEGSDFEVGLGTYTSSGTTLARTTVLLSKIGGTAGTSKMNLTGTAHVFVTALAEDINKALNADVWAAVVGKVLTSDLIETASAPVTLTHGSPTAFDWDAGINREWAITASVTLSNPTNGQPGTWRRLQITQDATGGRVVTWGNQYVHPGGTDAVLSTAANAVDTLYIYCRTTSIFEVHVGGKAWAT